MTYTALAQVSDFTAGPLAELVRGFSAQEQTNLLNRASRSVETYCGMRLAPFTNLTETYRVSELDVQSSIEGYGPIGDISTMIGISRARSLGSTLLVSDMWLNNYPPLWPDLWTGSLTSINLFRSFGGQTPVPVLLTAVQYEPDTGHIRFPIGTYIPQGTTAQVTYNGGYSTVPDDLVQATLYRAAIFALSDLSLERKGDADILLLKDSMEELLLPYTREQP